MLKKFRKDAFGIRFVFGKKQFVSTVAIQNVVAEFPMRGNHLAMMGIIGCIAVQTYRGASIVSAPTPRITKPKCGKDIDLRRVQASIADAYPD